MLAGKLLVHPLLVNSWNHLLDGSSIRACWELFDLWFAPICCHNHNQLGFESQIHGGERLWKRKTKATTEMNNLCHWSDVSMDAWAFCFQHLCRSCWICFWLEMRSQTSSTMTKCLLMQMATGWLRKESYHALKLAFCPHLSARNHRLRSAGFCIFIHLHTFLLIILSE